MPNNTKNIFKNKTLLITGGTGSIGSELVRQLLRCNPAQVRVFSRNDTRQYQLRENLKYPKNLRLLIGDIRDRDRLDFAFRGVDYIFHAAALKHVPLCEYNPFETAKTNIIGSQNVIDMAIKHNIEKVIAISTDKVVRPTNVMGVSKLMMEKLFIGAKHFTKNNPYFACVRFGNVAWSDGSVLPLWDQQARTGNYIRVTNKNMTRFFMSIQQAVQLVLRATVLTKGGEVFVLKMPSIKIVDLAKVFLQKNYPDRDIKIKFIDDRPGEKMHEYLIDPEERDLHLFSDNSMIIAVPKKNIYNLEKIEYDYPDFKKVNDYKLNSESNINHKEISKFI